MVNYRTRMSSETLPEHIRYLRRKSSSVYDSDSGCSMGSNESTISDVVQMYDEVTKSLSQSPISAAQNHDRKLAGSQGTQKAIMPHPKWVFNIQSSSIPEQFFSDGLATCSPPSMDVNNPKQPVVRCQDDARQKIAATTKFSGGLPPKKDVLKSMISPNTMSREQYVIIGPPVPSTFSRLSEHQPSRNFSRKNSFTTSPAQDILDIQMVPKPLNLGRWEQSGSAIAAKNTAGMQSYKSTPNLKPAASTESGVSKRHLIHPARLFPRSKSLSRASTSYHDGRTLPVDNMPLLKTESGLKNSAISRSNTHRRKLQKQPSKAPGVSSDVAENTPASNEHQRELALDEDRGRSMISGVHALRRTLSVVGITARAAPPAPALPIPESATAPTRSHSQAPRHAQIEIRKQAPQKGQRQKEDVGDDGVKRSCRSGEKEISPQHSRTSSTKSTASISSIIEGLRHTLTTKPSERRREKLKASIVVLGVSDVAAERRAVAMGMI